MANAAGFAPMRGTASDPRSLPSHRHPTGRACLVSLLGWGLAAAAAAQVPGAPSDEGERAWYTSFMARFHARVLPSFQVDGELESKLTRAWDGMVERLVARGEGGRPSPLDQYPLLGFVDDQFVVMRTTTPRGRETFVVRSEELDGVPTLTTTLQEYLQGAIYPSLQAIAFEERDRILRQPDYQPRLEQLSAHNPYQHGVPIRVPDMGPFKNRILFFTGPGGRLAAAEVAEYEQRKWGAAGGGQVVGLMRPQRWGLAVEETELVQRGEVVCRYRLVREVAAVADTFVGEGRRGVLLRQPRLGAVLQVSGCVGGCDDPSRWTRIHPEPGGDAPASLQSRRRAHTPMMDAGQRAPAQPGLPRPPS
jgi:hypothetical protein